MINRAALGSPVRVQVDGTEIATYVVEPVGAPPAGDVVMCHGTPWSAATWAPIAELLSGDYRVFLWDMPGYGESISEDAPHVDLVTQRRRFPAVLEHWGQERPHVLAHDIGGAVALGAHLFEGCQYASLYLLDIVTLAPWGSPFFRLVAQHEDVFAALPPRLHAALVREYIAGAAGDDRDPAWADELAQPWCTPDGQRAFYRQIAHLRPEHTEPIAARLAHVLCPVRIGWGERDPWIPFTQAADLADRLPGHVEVAAFPTAGHLAALEATDALGRDIMTWLGAAGRP